ncbi:MAG: twin-arginine translocase subunit TatC, partial [Candidatus Omnitrophica bacterium]|nr:twin-arginine translocase subunit TatC [Candidatus Omnitrophota bacterium]
MNKSPEDLSFFAHYEELRDRLIKSIVAVLAAACLFYLIVDKVFAFVIKPVGRLVFTAPGEAFVARIMLALFGGIFLALPVVLYQVWRFVAAGLKEHEAK